MAIERYRVVSPTRELTENQMVQVTMNVRYKKYLPNLAQLGFEDTDGDPFFINTAEVEKIVAEREVWEPQAGDIFLRDGVAYHVKDRVAPLSPAVDSYHNRLYVISTDVMAPMPMISSFTEDELIYRKGGKSGN